MPSYVETCISLKKFGMEDAHSEILMIFKEFKEFYNFIIRKSC